MVYVKRLILKRDRITQWDKYPYCLPVLRQFESLSFSKPVTFLCGENGSGKSTLLEAIAVGYGFNPEGGSRNFRFSTQDSHSPLYRDITLVKAPYSPHDGYFLRAESFYNVSTEVDHLAAVDPNSETRERFLQQYGGSLHEQSHGESFFSLILNRFRGQGFYLLDEPESALSPSRQLALLARMRQLVQGGSQFIIATHSPILMGYPDADIYLIEDGELTLTPYERTEHYIITKQFLGNRQRMLQELFEGQDFTT